jgi:hypothetical protein
VQATFSAGRWVVNAGPGDSVTIPPGGIVDDFGETNGGPITLN